MEHRTLGKTGLSVSTVGMGCWQIGGQVPRGGWTGVTDEESIATIHHCLDVGINLLDSAEGYGDGHSEVLVGKALKGRREKYIVATKVVPLEEESTEEEARKRITEGCEDSLERLQTDYIDVYQLHRIPHESTMGAVMDSLGRLKAQGKVRFIGVSTNDVDAVKSLMAHGEISVLQVGYNILNREGEDALKLAKTENLGTLIRVPLASGVLSGKYFGTVPALDEGDRRVDRFTSEEAIEKFRKLSDLLFLTEGERRTMVQAALRFILDTEGVTSVIPGAKNRQQLEGNAGTMDVPPITPEERAKTIEIADQVGVI